MVRLGLKKDRRLLEGVSRIIYAQASRGKWQRHTHSADFHLAKGEISAAMNIFRIPWLVSSLIDHFTPV